MAALRRLLLRLLHAWRPERAEPDLAREVAAHLALLEDEYQRRGMTADEARTAARLALGVEQAKIRHRDARSFRWLDELLHDLRHTRRMLLRHWRSSLIAILILTTVGVVNAAILGVADGVLFRPLPYSDATRIHVVQLRSDKTGDRFTRVGNDILQLLREPRDEFSGAEFIDAGPRITVQTPEGPSAVVTMRATTNYFALLGVRPALGRLFATGDVEAGHHVGLLTYEAWRSRFGEDDGVVGRPVTIGDAVVHVVGVLPPGLFLPVVRAVTLATQPELYIATPYPPPAADTGAFYSIVRLEDDVTLERAQSVLSTVFGTLPARGGDESTSPVFDPVESVLFPAGRPIMRWLVAGTVALLVLACVNLASLMLVRSQGRAREVGIRLALGASRARIVRPVLFEVVLLSLASGMLAVAVGKVLFEPLLAQVPRLAYENAPVGIDLRVSIMTIVLGLMTTLVFTFVPGWRAVRRDAQALIRAGTSRGSAPAWRMGRPLLAIQVALAVVLVFGGILTARAFIAVLQVPLGFDADNVAEINVPPPSGVDREDFYLQVLEAIRQRPGVVAAGAAGQLPFSGRAPDEGVRTEPGQPPVGLTHVLPGFFEAVKMPLVHGRVLVPGDAHDDPDAAVISESASRVLFPGRDPIGGVFDNGRGRTFHVVGVVADVRQNVREEPRPLVFAVPNAGRRGLVLMVRASSDNDAVLRDLRQTVRELAPGSRVTAEWWAASIADVSDYRNPRFQTLVLGTLGFVGLALTAFGIVGVVGFLVAARTRELGIRAVIGATPGSLVRLVVAQGLVPVASGLVAGLIATRWAGRLAEAQLFEVDTDSATTLALTAVVILLITIAAAWLPARRAGRVDPIVVLRAE